MRIIKVNDGAERLFLDLDLSLLADRDVLLEARLRHPEYANSACMRYSRFQLGDSPLVQVDYGRRMPSEKHAEEDSGHTVRQAHDARVFPLHLVVPSALPEYIEIAAEGVPAIDLVRTRLIPEAYAQGYQRQHDASIVLRARAGGKKDPFYHTIAALGRINAELREPEGLEWISEGQFQALSSRYPLSMVPIV